MTEQDGFRVEAALQFGFQGSSHNEGNDGDTFLCTEAQLIAFAKACERKGLAEALSMWSPHIRERIAELDAELAPIREAETVRYMTAAGYVCGPGAPGKLWVKP